MSGAEVISLGCRLNIAESERMKLMLGVSDDVVVINSCAVTSEAVRQTRQAIRKADCGAVRTESGELRCQGC